MGRGFWGAGAPCLCYFSLLRQRKVTKRKATPTRRAVLSGRHKVAAWAQGRPAPCALDPRHGITAGLRPSERASNAAVGASGGWFSAGALRSCTGGAYGGGNWAAGFVCMKSFRTFVPRRDSITVESCLRSSKTSGRKSSLLFRPVELIEGAVYEPMHRVLGVVRVSVLVYVPSEKNVESN